MLEIFVSNQKVDLPTDIQIALTIENPMMLQDRVPTPYSLTFNLPPTPKNLKIFRFPNRLASFKSSRGVVNTLSCRILFNAITIAGGVLRVSQYDAGIKAQFQGVDIDETLRGTLYNAPMHRYLFPTTDWTDRDFDDPGN